MSAAVMPTSTTANRTMRVAIDPRRIACKTPERSVRHRGLRRLIVASLLLGFWATMLPARAAGGTDVPQTRLQLTRDPSGDGYVVPGTGLWLGADATVKLTVPEAGPDSAELDAWRMVRRESSRRRLSRT